MLCYSHGEKDGGRTSLCIHARCFSEISGGYAGDSCHVLGVVLLNRFLEGLEPLRPLLDVTLIVQAFLDDLFVRQIRNRKGAVEGDDFIAYYCKTKAPNDKVTIVTHDRDLCQLINEDIQIFLIDRKSYVTHYNYNQYAGDGVKKVNIFNFHKENAVLVKTICGDSSDSIRGVKGMGEKTLLTNKSDSLNISIIEINLIRNLSRETEGLGPMTSGNLLFGKGATSYRMISF